MSKLIRFLILTLVLIAVVQPAFSQSSKRTINIGYFEGGDYLIHKAIMGELRKHLENLSDDNIEIAFDPYGYRTAEWNRDLCRAMAGDLARMKNLDMIIAAGPWVVKDLLDAGYDKPIIGLLQNEPELTGLVDKTGLPTSINLTLTYDPNKLETDLAAMAYLFPNSKCGFVYFPSGDEFEAVVEKTTRIANNYELELIPSEKYSQSGTYSFFISAEPLKKEIDVLYVPSLWGLDLETIREFFTQIHFDQVKTFTTEGYFLLEKGAIASNCDRPYHTLARIAAYKIDRIIKGTTPARLPTQYEESKILCLNPNESKKTGAGFGRNIFNKAKLVPETPLETIERFTLKMAMEQAVFENADLHAENSVYEQAVLETKKAFSSFLPDISAKAGITTAGNEEKTAFYNDTFNKKSFAGIELEQKLFSYPAIKAIHAAQKNRERKNNDLQQAIQDIKKTVA
ncbi:MAG: TolC family protein, partial [candidate division Zixibacteria bacterium]|nr:TolC family protein [candidate division Zixibacteria bacterium]